MGTYLGRAYSFARFMSDDQHYRCGYSHIQSGINIASEEATTGTVQLWIFQYTGHINKDPHEDSGSFMYWSTFSSRAKARRGPKRLWRIHHADL